MALQDVHDVSAALLAGSSPTSAFEAHAAVAEVVEPLVTSAA